MANGALSRTETGILMDPYMGRTGMGRKLFHDKRSRDYPYPTKLSKLKTVRHMVFAQALDQGDTNMCTGYAAAQFINSVAAKNIRSYVNRFTLADGPRPRNKYLGHADAVDLYGLFTEHDPFDWTYPPDDSGGSSVGIGKALKACGAIKRYEWALTFPTFLGALARQPVLLGTVWPDSLSYPDDEHTIRATGSLDTDEHHEYLAVGIDKPRNAIRIRNSWGPEWGINGDAYVPIPDMEKLLAAQGDCLVPLVY